MNLNNCIKNEVYTVIKINGESTISTRRLTYMGVIPNEEIKVINEKKGAILVKIKGSKLIISREIAKKVIVASVV